MIDAIPLGVFSESGAPLVWEDEARWAVRYLVSTQKDVPAGAANDLHAAVLQAVEEMLAPLLKDAPEHPGSLPEGCTPAQRAEWSERRHLWSDARFGLTWGIPRNCNARWILTDEGGLPEMAPLDAALVERLRALGDTAGADLHAEGARKAIGDIDKPPEWRWRTHHEQVKWMVETPRGDAWPPEGFLALCLPLPIDRESEQLPEWIGEAPELTSEGREELEGIWRLARERSGANSSGTRFTGQLLSVLQESEWIRKGWLPPVRLVQLAHALWEHGGVKAEWEAKQEKHAALTRGVTTGVIEVLSPHRQVEMALDGEWRVRSADGKTVALIDGNAAALLSGAKDLDLLSSVWFGRLTDLVVNTAHDQREAGGMDFRRVVIHGGLAALRGAIGYQKSSNADLKKALEVGQCLRLEAAGESGGGLWTWRAYRGGPGRPGRVELVLGSMLLPGFVLEGGESARSLSRARRVARLLIPVLATPPPWQADGVNARDYGRVYAAHRGALVHYRDHVRAKDGSAPLPTDALRRIVAKAGLDSNARDAVLEVWLQGDGERPPLFERDGTDVRLTDTHAAAREFMRRGAERQESGRKRGKAHARHKAARGAGKGRKGHKK